MFYPDLKNVIDCISPKHYIKSLTTWYWFYISSDIWIIFLFFYCQSYTTNVAVYRTAKCLLYTINVKSCYYIPLSTVYIIKREKTQKNICLLIKTIGSFNMVMVIFSFRRGLYQILYNSLSNSSLNYDKIDGAS